MYVRFSGSIRARRDMMSADAYCDSMSADTHRDMMSTCAYRDRPTAADIHHDRSTSETTPPKRMHGHVHLVDVWRPAVVESAHLTHGRLPVQPV